MRRALPLLLALPAAALAGPSASADPIERELVAARSEQRQAEAEAARLANQAARAETEVQRLAARRAAAAADLAAAEAAMSGAALDLKRQRRAAAAQLAELEKRQAPVAALVAGLVSMGRRPPILAIASADGTSQLVRTRMLLDATVPVIRARTAALSADLEERKRIERRASAAVTILGQARKALDQRKARLAELERSAEGDAAQLGSSALAAGDRVIATGEQSAGLETRRSRDLAARRAAAELAAFGPAEPSPFRPQSQVSRPGIAYVIPVEGRVVDGVGSVSDNGIASRGVTFAAFRGATVAMPASGTIAFAGPHGRHDGVVILDHGQGWMTMLIGVRTSVAKGTRLAAGAPLGKALGPVTVELSMSGRPVSATLTAFRAPVTGR